MVVAFSYFSNIPTFLLDLTLVMNKPFSFTFTTAVVTMSAISILSSCAIGSSIAQSNSQSAKDNTIALLFVKRNNLNQQYHAELFPIAKYSNGRYQDASLDVTPQIQENSTEAAIVKANATKSSLQPNQTFTAFTPGSKLGEFTVNRLGVGQYACSSLLIGSSEKSQADFVAAYNAIPRDREGKFVGFMNGKDFDETSRWSLAAQTATLPAVPQSFDRNRYSRDISRAANTILARNAEARKVQGRTVIEEIQVYDLDRDGKPEVFATVRKGRDPKTIQPREVGTNIPIAYVTLWLSYKTNTPTVIFSEVIPYTHPVSRIPSNVIGTIDVNSDRIDEVIIKNNGYESTTFSIYELKGNQLKSVFTGAGYGC